ncbi:MAG: hypothetical protein ACOX9B_04650 [Candidatus Xenobium sp.]|jgi:hypothetical protein
MSMNVGGPGPQSLPENHARILVGKNRDAWLPRDAEQVRVSDPDSLAVDGRSVDAGASAVKNLQALGRTLKMAVLPDKTVGSLKKAFQARRGIAVPVQGVLAGLAADVLDLVKAPPAAAKDGLDAAAWSAVAGMTALKGPQQVSSPRPALPTEPPEFSEVHMRTPTQARSGYFHYALKDGKVWTRWDPILPQGPVAVRCGEPMTEEGVQSVLKDASGPYSFTYESEGNQFVATPLPDAAERGFKMIDGRLVPAPLEEAGEWHLHEGLGGPVLLPGEHAVEIQVAGDFIEVRTNTNKMYSYDPTKPSPVAWKAEAGCPFGGEIQLPEGIRDWTFGEAVAVKPMRNCLKSMNPFTDIVGYFEDSQGNKGDFGFTATTGVLTGDGREIRYRDTGLPADFARGFLTPHHGRFTGEKLAAAGATWLLYGREPDGRPGLYARMYDYEINGDCPGRHYSYDHSEVSALDLDKVYSLSEQIQTLPTPGWARIPFPPLTGQAMLTDHIDIRLTGQGNAAREVRLAGRDAEGNTGYYHKGLSDAEWNFTRVPGPLLGETIPVGHPDPARATPEPITRDYPRATWSGDLTDAPLSQVELLDFHPFQTQDQASRIRFTLDSGQSIEVLLRTGDGYTPYAVRPQDTELLGEGVGAPKVLIGTLELPEEVRNHSDPEVRSFVEGHLEQMHHKENQFMLVAESDRVEVSTDWYYRKSDHRFDWDKNPKIRLSFQRDDTGQTPYELKAASPDLRPAPGMTNEELAELVTRNQALEAEITSEVSSRQRHHLHRWMRAQVSEAVVTGLMWLASALNVSGRVKHTGQFTQLLPPLVKAHTRADWQAARTTPPGVLRAQQTLRENISQAENLQTGD